MQPISKHPSIEFLQRHRFAMLLTSQFILLMTAPFAQMMAVGLSRVTVRLLIGIPFILLVLSTLIAVGSSQRVRLAVLFLALPTILLELLDVAWTGTIIHSSSHVATVVFLGVAIIMILQFIFSRKRVNSDVVYASLCVYIMLGTLFAYLYAFVETVIPGSFCFTELDPSQVSRLDIGGSQSVTAFYFSFVTMTTLGYGDIYPISSIAKMAATIQSILGQLYLTVLVARLVGLHIAHSAAEREELRDKKLKR